MTSDKIKKFTGTVRVKMLCTRSGPGYRYQIGNEYSLPADIAGSFIKNRACILLPQPDLYFGVPDDDNPNWIASVEEIADWQDETGKDVINLPGLDENNVGPVREAVAQFNL